MEQLLLSVTKRGWDNDVRQSEICRAEPIGFDVEMSTEI